jgi:hypothetical protein
MTIAWMILCLLSQYNGYQKTKIIEMQEILNSKQTNVILLQDELISIQEKNLDIQTEILSKLSN